jgi:pseudooxynicotine oxidase
VSTTEIVEIAVVGGGFAGVTAARELAQAGHQVLLLEAKDRLGGRTHSLQWHGETIELGGTWVHYLQPFVWSEIVRAGLSVRSFGKADVTLFNAGDGPKPLSEEDIRDSHAAWDAYLGDASKALSEPFDVDPGNPVLAAIDAQTMAERLDSLDLEPAARVRLSAGLTAWANGPIDRAGALLPHRLYGMSGFSVAALEATTSDLVLTGGTGALVTAMAGQADVDVRFEATVAAVRQHDGHIRIECADGATVQADVVVIALPLNVLGDVEFDPALPAAPAAAIAARQTSAGCKVLIKARGSKQRFDAASVGTAFAHVLTDRFFADGAQLLVAFGPDAAVLAGAGLPEVQHHLDAVVPGLTVEDFQWHDWTADPCAQGTWAAHAAQWVTNYATALDDPVGNVYFAGSDLAHGWVSHIDGAIETGIRTARQIRRRIAESEASTQTSRKDVP